MDWARREDTGVLHLHGVWNVPETVVLGVSDYNEAISDDFRVSLQRALSTFNRLLFIGCGDTFEDPNFSSLIRWCKQVLGGAGLQHYALVANADVAARERDPLWEGVINPIGYGNAHADLPEFLQSEIIIPAFGSSPRRKDPTDDATVISTYKRFLIGDCGQMTIEGVGADAETAKQKFDIEKLFVPLEVSPIPPEFAKNDVNREKKLAEWHKKNIGPIAFGDALRRHQKIALLALPGGGKTLLLKRLAVAYADSSRRTATEDQLPELDMVPVLIRCREWRTYISQPIPNIIDKIADITGKRELNGLYGALLPRLRAGKVMLLIDGLDEIHSDAERSTFVDNLERFLDEFRKIRLVVTSREAGFALVAPCLMRFCVRWRVAPLSRPAISMLCDHWHELMGGANAESIDESYTVVEAIHANDALTRLAENPLLLTMLLVVKHGYGRLPPDRVSLYERAVEVLLDTWNIKGHSALNPREALPQLAYVAYRMMQQGQQTVTEKELLILIEDCRRDIPLVRLYAKDTPNEFLKRVELRSSLLLEAGRQLENGKTVAFYQFRHLTFQEYLASVAVVEGHYKDYIEGQSALAPLTEVLTLEEWKEVIPMAAVLAKKQAAPLLTELVKLGESVETAFLATEHTDSRYGWSVSYRMPSPVGRLAQCFVEEAEFSQANLMGALRLVGTFAHGCASPENWGAMLRGPYGQELFRETWRLYSSGGLPKQAWLRNTTARMAAYRKSTAYFTSPEGVTELAASLRADDRDNKGKAAATICGLLWESSDEIVKVLWPLCEELQANLVFKDPVVWEHTVWALGLLQTRHRDTLGIAPQLTTASLDIMVEEWVGNITPDDDSIISFGLSASLVFVRSTWRPNIDEQAKFKIRSLIESNAFEKRLADKAGLEAAALIAYHARLSVARAQIVAVIGRLNMRVDVDGLMNGILLDLGATTAELGDIKRGVAPRRRRA